MEDDVLLLRKETIMSYIECSKYTAACYCRLSRDDENDGTSVSIETQKKVLEDYCRSNDYEVYNFYCDDGYTGTNFERPSFKQMMSDVSDGAVNMIVVKDLSRFGRNYIEVGKYVEETFPDMGVRFIAIGDDVDTNRDNLDLDLMLPMKNIFNQYYPADCSRKTRQAFVTKAKRGEFIGSQAPYGYKKSPEDKHVLIIDEETAPTVKWIFEMAAYQGYGYNKIARVLTDRKVITPAALQAKRAGRGYDKDPYDWNLATVYRMMENTAYLGHLTSGKRRKISFKNKRIKRMPEEKWIVNENMHEPLISEQLWEDAHFRLGTRKRTSESGFVNIFAGLLKCDKCGYALGIANASGKDNYYTCNTYKKKGKDKCSSHYIRYDELYNKILSDLNEMLRVVQNNKEAFVETVKAKIGGSSDEERQRMSNESEEVEKRLNELDKKFDMLYNDRLDGLISDKKFKEMSARCESEQEELSERLEQLQEKLRTGSEKSFNLDRFVELICGYEHIEQLDKEILNLLIDRIVVSDRIKEGKSFAQTITVYYRFVGCM